jgi:rare lipoprotein A
MLRRTVQVLLLSCMSAATLTTPASAQRAPITYAGQTSAAAPAVTQTASLGSSGLSGGDENSYGYGGGERRPRGAVIDLRRPEARRAQPVVIEQPASEPEDDEEEAGGPVALTPARYEQPAAQAPAPSAPEQGAPAWLERERVGPPYEANGRWYVPTPEPGYAQTGTASWYGAQFHGQRTASGETFDQDALTAAHPTLPIPSLVQVTNLENGREVIVRVNDRGPFVGERLIDMSRAGAQALGFEQAGQARVHVRYLGPAPRRVSADGTPAPASTRIPAAPQPQQAVEEGPRSLLPPSVESAELAGAPTGSRATPASVVGGYFVQVGAYSDPANAQRVRAEVAAAGPVAMDVRQTASGVELFRVRIGPWASREEADAARRTLNDLGYADSVVASR